MTEPGIDPESPRERYRRAVATLATPLHDRVAGRDRADQALVAGRREIAASLADSAARVRAADEVTEHARTAVRATDTEATRIWRDLGTFTSRRRDLGPPPGPRGLDGAHPATAPALLARAERTLAQARRGELRIAPPLPIWAAMLTAGVLGALVLAGVGKALLVATHGMATEEQAGARIIAEIAFFAAPLAGIPLGLAWLSRYGQPMTARAFAIVLAAGIVVGCGLFGLFAH